MNRQERDLHDLAGAAKNVAEGIRQLSQLVDHLASIDRTVKGISETLEAMKPKEEVKTHRTFAEALNAMEACRSAEPPSTKRSK